MQMNGKEYHAILERAAANVVTIDIANALIDGAISVSGPPVSSDVRSQPLDFQSIASDLHLVKSDLCTRCVAASIQCQTLAVLVQLEFLAAQPLFIGAQIRHGTCLSKAKRAGYDGCCEGREEHSAHDGLSPQEETAAGL